MLLFLAIASVTANYPEENHVLVLTKSTIDQALEQYPKLLVEFYAPWCEHCKEFAPEYSRAAEVLKKKKIPLAKIDGSENREIVDKYNVKGYPSLLFFLDGIPTDYTGLRTAEGIVDWVSERQKKKIFKVKDSGGLSAVLQKPLVAIFFGAVADSERSIFEFAALNVKGVDFYETDSESDAEAQQIKRPKVAVFENGVKTEYNENFSTIDLVKFIEKFKPTKVHKFNQQTAKMIFDYQSPTFFFLSDSSTYENHKEDIYQLAVKYKSLLIFTSYDLSGQDLGDKLSGALGLTTKDQPISVIVDFKESYNKYKTTDFNKEALETFIEGYRSNTLAPYYKSAEIPDPDTENSVKVIVGKTHDSVIKDPSKTVLVLYYVPDHQKCAEFLPKYERLAKETKKWDDLVVGKFDLNDNELEGLKIKLIPHIRLFPKEKKEGIIYGGELTKFDLKEFIRKYLEVNKDL